MACERPPAASRLSPFVRGTMSPSRLIVAQSDLLSPLRRGTAAKRQGVAHTPSVDFVHRPAYDNTVADALGCSTYRPCTSAA